MSLLADNNNNNKKEITFMWELFLWWYFFSVENQKMSHCQLLATSKQRQITSRKITGSVYGKHILTSDNCSSQHNTKPLSLMETRLPFPRKLSSGALRDRDGFQRKPVSMSRDGRKWHHWISRWEGKQHQCTVSSVLPRKIKITWGVTGGESPAKTYILPKHLKPKYWLIQSCFEWSPQQCITLLWV